MLVVIFFYLIESNNKRILSEFDFSSRIRFVRDINKNSNY